MLNCNPIGFNVSRTSAPKDAPKCAKRAKSKNNFPNEKTVSVSVFSEFDSPLAHETRISFSEGKRNFTKKVRQTAPTSAPNIKTMADALTSVKMVSSGKRWYVEFYRNGKRVREYGYINREKNKQMRLRMLQALRDEIVNTLINPNAKTEGRSNSVIHINSAQSISEWLDFILQGKEKSQRYEGFKTTKKYYASFKRFLEYKGLLNVRPSEITKTDMAEFQNWLVAIPNSNRSVNNCVSFINNFFRILINKYDGILDVNPCRGLEKLRSESETHVAYTDKQVKELKAYMEKRDPLLFLFSKFIVYCFMRISETRSIQLSWLDLDEGTITQPAWSVKQSKPKVRYIPQVFLDELREMKRRGKLNGEPSDYLFSVTGIVGKQGCGRTFISDRFRPVRHALKLSTLHTLYGLRHTYVSMLLEAGMNPQDIMPYTGHDTLAAFSVYARSLRFKKPKKDISAKFRVKF